MALVLTCAHRGKAALSPAARRQTPLWRGAGGIGHPFRSSTAAQRECKRNSLSSSSVCAPRKHSPCCTLFSPSLSKHRQYWERLHLQAKFAGTIREHVNCWWRCLMKCVWNIEVYDKTLCKLNSLIALLWNRSGSGIVDKHGAQAVSFIHP